MMEHTVPVDQSQVTISNTT